MRISAGEHAGVANRGLETGLATRFSQFVSARQLVCALAEDAFPTLSWVPVRFVPEGGSILVSSSRTGSSETCSKVPRQFF